jgi:hypothetical protein
MAQHYTDTTPNNNMDMEATQLVAHGDRVEFFALRRHHLLLVVVGRVDVHMTRNGNDMIGVRLRRLLVVVVAAVGVVGLRSTSHWHLGAGGAPSQQVLLRQQFGQEENSDEHGQNLMMGMGIIFISSWQKKTVPLVTYRREHEDRRLLGPEVGAFPEAVPVVADFGGQAEGEHPDDEAESGEEELAWLRSALRLGKLFVN